MASCAGRYVSAISVTSSRSAAADGVGVTGHDVVRGAGDAETPVAASTSGTATVTGLSAGTAYPFAGYARDAAGNRSVRSGAVDVTTGSGPAAPCSSG
ncbi:hypothetical protein [Streptomyces antibioticus]|uniref:hypothetical protein n=1 Tax=Streptomyces antibioticus TaxID=1890 RepID=UPI0033FDCDD4